MYRVCTFLLFIFAILNSPSLSAASLIFFGIDEKRDQYYADLLSEIIQHTALKDSDIIRYDVPLPHHRAFISMQKKRDIDIVVGYATKERDKNYLAIAIPLMKGVNGWRLAVVNSENESLFNNIDSLLEFKKLTPGQAHAWTDFKILTRNGIKTLACSNLNGMYSMLQNKRIDYFPRAVIEVENEIKDMSDTYDQVKIDPKIMITYPAAFYFYVRKDNLELANELTKGFETIIANGQFDALFSQYFAQTLKNLNIEQRRIFQLDNPFLPESVPLSRQELWAN